MTLGHKPIIDSVEEAEAREEGAEDARRLSEQLRYAQRTAERLNGRLK